MLKQVLAALRAALAVVSMLAVHAAYTAGRAEEKLRLHGGSGDLGGAVWLRCRIGVGQSECLSSLMPKPRISMLSPRRSFQKSSHGPFWP